MNPSQAITSSRGENLQFLAFMFICVYSNRSRAELTCVMDYHLSYFFDYNTVRRDAKASGNKGLLGRRAFSADGTLGAYGEKMVNVEAQYSFLNTAAGGSGHLHNLSLSLSLSLYWGIQSLWYVKLLETDDVFKRKRYTTQAGHFWEGVCFGRNKLCLVLMYWSTKM